MPAEKTRHPSKIKVLLLIDRLGAGGKERQLIELLKGLERRREVECRLAVLANQQTQLLHSHFPDLHKLDTPIHYLDRRSAKDLSAFGRLYRLCRDFQPHILHSWELMCSVYALPLAKMLGIRFINNTIQNAPARIGLMSRVWLRSRLTFPFSDVVLANSRAGLKAYRAPARKSAFIHNGFDLERIQQLQDPQILRRELGIPTSRVVGMVGKFISKKDYPTFIRAGLMLLEKYQDLSFIAVGDGPQLANCRKMIPPAQRDRFIFPGNRQEVESIVNLFDVGVLATFTEGISNAIMEYMALGKPVVATDGGGTGEIVLDGQTGFLVKASDPAALAAKVGYLLDHPMEAQAMGQAGRERLIGEFNLQAMTQQFIELYQQQAGNALL